MADRDIDAAIAVTRFGLGARPGEIAEAASDPQGWLRAQIRREGADLPAANGETTRQRLADFREYQQERQATRREAAQRQATMQDAQMQAGAPPRRQAGDGQQVIRRDVGDDFLARAQLGATTEAGFRERWALFFANHFTVSATKLVTSTVAGPFEAEAIRPHVFGSFAELLGAAATHPAMLTYLDQAQSVGPNSRAAQGRGRQLRPQQGRQRRGGLNENLAREILELHTVGVDGGYSQADVTEFARAMTGLSIAGPRQPNPGGAVFREAAHEPGTRTVMGRRYSGDGRAQVGAILADLAAKPQTARFVCRKIARHFVADDPPPALTARLEAAWTASGGALARVAEALIAAPEAWTPQAAKFKTPYEFVISSYRAVGGQPRGPAQIGPVLNGMGQRPFGSPSPKGWPEEAEAWATADAVIKRMQFAQSFARLGVATDPRQLAQEALGARLTPAVATAVARAESRPEAVALLLMSPEFQRR